jgi:hypothetical protein
MNMLTNRSAAIGGIACALVLAFPVFAHHSTGMFDQTQTLSRAGTVNQFDWINPHAWLHVDFTDENGVVTTWAFEGGNIGQLAQLGWRLDDFAQGTEIIVGYRPMKDGSRGGQLMSATLTDGRKICSNRGCG